MGSNAEDRSVRVLVHAPFGRDNTLLRSVLQRAGMEAADCRTIDGMCVALLEGAAALLIGDEALSDAGILRLRGALLQQQPWSDLPVFVMMRPGETGGRFQCLQRLQALGNVSLLDRPLRADTIVSAFQMALRARVRQYDIRDHLESERRTAAALARANIELRRANEDLNQFAFSASHDLQEPLRMVAVFTEMLETEFGQQLGPRAAQYMSFVLKGSRRMEELLKDLLSYVQAVNLEDQEVSRTDANEVVRESMENLQRSILETGAQVECGPLPVVMVKRVHLLQLFQNLIGNALKYRGEDQPRVCVSARRCNGDWRFNVRDNGIGVEPQFAEHIFGVFKRLHSGHEKYGGTGIGLAICQKIVERYGGRIWVESGGRGQGSLFSFTFPAAGHETAHTCGSGRG